MHFYPRSPRGERRMIGCVTSGLMRFLSTLPARGATRRGQRRGPKLQISIHAPREGSDGGRVVPVGRGKNFYPRSPRGERRKVATQKFSRITFLSTLPARGATWQSQFADTVSESISIHAPREGSDRDDVHTASLSDDISIHAPREGSDSLRRWKPRCWRYFYPRSPRGERLGELAGGTAGCPISIHAPREGSDSRLMPMVWPK